ncbi:pyruvate ferredoxin oxidoreductase [candidate division WWE3 bacterium CG08_land_8_20_14_0_20_41_15]|uniref:Pyruvate ferredoxin oxidoreductase n=1 Tax=candidate division WWE3 bacterium CG08_land_8_20_14_0_20_41_15 TaxID=1975086 RepID=A0A2H0XBP1_UNCKA|nr:MAG: pyruvate ferredoxin oxidoreductase [candidate division WWE3 bacterium CG08_land_8_20_14_0_20_41_15]
MSTLIELSKIDSRLSQGHRSCSGCGFPQIIRTVLRSIDAPVVVSLATGCMEVTTTIFPESSWKVPLIHSAFENASATISGAISAFENIKKTGKWNARGKDPVFVVFGGDGGTYDIGLQSLSGAIERGHNFLYICYDNEAYMNTGVQRSSATPFGAETTTSLFGEAGNGKITFKKPLTEIIVAHGLPYVAQASVSHILDLHEKVKKAISFRGPKFINVLATCPVGWRVDSEKSMEVARLAVETRYWPLYEVENGEYHISVDIPNPKPVTEFLKIQGRFKNLIKNEIAIKYIQDNINKNWEGLKKHSEI